MLWRTGNMMDMKTCHILIALAECCLSLQVFMDELLLPWSVKAAVLLHADTLVLGDLPRLWNATAITSDALRRERRRAAAKAKDRGGAVVVQADQQTALGSGGARDGVAAPAPVLAAVPNCEVPQSKVRHPTTACCNNGTDDRNGLSSADTITG